MSDKYWETLCVFANQALHNIVPSTEDILVNVEVDVIVEMRYHAHILKAFSMFHDRDIICILTRYKSYDRLGSSMIKCYIIRNCLNNVYKC